MRHLSVSSDAKTIKGESRGYLTGILYLSPASSSGIANVCSHASPGCMRACLNTAGRYQIFPEIKRARIRRTRELFRNRAKFLADIEWDIRALVRRAERVGLIPCVRLNGTSDLPWLAHHMASKFPSVQFYDYTKHPKPWERIRHNYALTFSKSETNLVDALDALRHGINVAVVFDTHKGQALPGEWNGFKVVDGDVSDLRFLDARGVVVGLRAKGKAKRDCSGFVESSLVQIQIGGIAA